MSFRTLKLFLILTITYQFNEYGVVSLKLAKVILPPHKLVGEQAVLQCPYELERDRLYAVKWFKDGEEFVRFVPKKNPPMQIFKVDGINVQTSISDSKQVVLQNLELQSTGKFRCEVFAEGPSFASVRNEGNMTVVHLPAEGPQISGTIFEEYEIGDVIRFNCTTAESFPPARLFWYINDLPIDATFVKMLSPSKNYSATTLTKSVSKSELVIPLEERHFQDGSAKIRCVASIFALFWQDVDEKIVNNGNFRENVKSVVDPRSIFKSPIIDDREAQVLVRGSSSTRRGDIVILTSTLLLTCLY